MQKIGKFSFEFGLWATTFAMTHIVIVSLMLVAVVLHQIFGEGLLFDALAAIAVCGLGGLFAVSHIRTSYFISKNSQALFEKKYPKFKDVYYWSWIGGITRMKLDWIFVKYTFNFKRADREVLLSV